MERSNSFGTSWADQWDYSNPDPIPEQKKSGDATAKYKKKVGEGFEKTKSVASAGFKKVKEGTSVGLKWIKDKYQKRTQKC
ncbi:PREDICTED: uncharacterized protein LOC104596014 [Nelumbo nucifera]|uniref:Uncharacterized protein LOC104596014 n=2 Tax=Nelumbo nucifera TaxID=4432 RepID=A0A1U7ZT83_NELNU|nr:PREDICTED: uncharacterized protein LOC104596014 [Nelumbo nucifera]DAD34714.1 TPA_asm: hypothetical protein HUJ06_005354 [Nelumbo nucifera]